MGHFLVSTVSQHLIHVLEQLLKVEALFLRLLLVLLLVLLLLGSLVIMAEVLFQTMHQIYQVGERCCGVCTGLIHGGEGLRARATRFGPKRSAERFCDEG